MGEFLKYAYEIIAQIIYYWADIFDGLVKYLVTGWPGYISIFKSYFSQMNFGEKVLAILLSLILIAIPLLIVFFVVRHFVLKARLKADGVDNSVLYKEIGRLNKQVLDLMDEKRRILSMKVDAMNAGGNYAGGYALNEDGTGIVGPGGQAVSIGGFDPLAEGGAAVGGAILGGGGGVNDDAIAGAAAAAASAAAHAKAKATEDEENAIIRFPKLSLVDSKYEDYETPEFDNEVTLEQLVERYRLFAASQLHLYYTPDIIRRFVAGMSASKLLILEGISGTGKTSLPYSFSRFFDNPATMVSVQPSFRDRTELLGYFNEFSKKFNETEFLRTVYEAGYHDDPSFVILDEMNLARIEYYFAEMLSILEMPSYDEWILDLVPTAWPGDPRLLDGGKIKISPHLWFVGTANSDDSTFTITDKVYDRAMLIELNQRADKFECELEPRCRITCDHLYEMFAKAREDHPISDATLAKMIKIDQYLQTRFKLAFGNRIMKQMYDFIPVFVGCGGTEVDGLDYILSRKVLKKFESLGFTFVKDEITGLMEYIEKQFGKGNMRDSLDYLRRVQNMY